MGYFIKLVKIDKCDFGFYGNDCDYYLNVYDENKCRIGDASVKVVNMGVDYSGAYEFIYDYDLSDEDARTELAEMLHVDEIKDEWLDEDGQIDTSKLPKEVCEEIEDGEDEILMDWYYEDFAENADEDGFMELGVFAEKYIVRRNGTETTKLDADSPLEYLFEENGIDGWYEEVAPDIDLSKYPTDISTAEGKALLDKILSKVTDGMEDLDSTSGYVNVSFGGDYSREEEAKEYMAKVYAKISELVLEKYIPALNALNQKNWKESLSSEINEMGRRCGFLYSDSFDEDFSEITDSLYEGLVNDEW